MATPMRTVSFKLPEDLDDTLNELARSRGASRSALLREALEALAKGKRRSVTALAGNLVGSLEGPTDLATNRKHMAAYGR
jgi:Arc/MetJ-type ribon-helix-helix transcriptional regulator